MSPIRFENILLFIALLIAAWCFFMGWPVDRADAHEAPAGWSYPLACCSLIDCREVGAGTSSPVRIVEESGGFRVSTTGEVIPYSDPRVRQSPDGEFHWCSTAGSDVGDTICIFAPPRAF